jgi:hypothetical protein
MVRLRTVMHIVKTFMAGAFLGGGAFGALTHVAWATSLSAESFIPALTVADVVEAAGAVVAGLVALFIVHQEDRRAANLK